VQTFDVSDCSGWKILNVSTEHYIVGTQGSDVPVGDAADKIITALGGTRALDLLAAPVPRSHFALAGTAVESPYGAGRWNPRCLGDEGQGLPTLFHEPRKLRSSVFSIWKHGSNGMPWTDAQTASPLTLSVPAGSDTVRAGPAPRNWMVPMK
jgi:hypothetical protein